MISIYDKFATKNQVLFNDGLAVLDDICLNYEITEKANGEYGATFRFGIDQINNKHEFIVDEAIIKCPDVYGDEVFRISKITKNSNREIQVYARHITYDILNLFLEDVRPTELNGQAFLDWIFTRTTTSHEFTYSSDITSTATSYFINKNVYEALFSADNSFLNRLGGEVRRNQYHIAINASSGQYRGVTIQSRKNLTGFEAYTDIDSVITRIYPKGSNDLTIPEKYIDSQYVNNYPNIKSQEVVFNGIGVDEENGVTEAEAQQQLRDAVGKMYSEQQVDLLRGEYKIDFVTLEKTEEYKPFGLLERIWLYDTVSVYEENYDIDINVKVIERKYNGKRQIHNSISLSNVAEKSVSTINKIISMLNSISDPQTGFLQQAKDNATQLITNGLANSYVLVRKNEILIMDTQDINTAVKVWRWNVNGLGYSNTGYNGTFGLAMTMDGSIVADFINTGLLTANIIKTGTLASLDGSISINIANGTFRIGGRSGDVAEITNSYAKFSHSNGSYSRVDSNGFYNYIGSTGREYHHLFYNGTLSFSGSLITVTLPDEFKGKNFTVSPYFIDSTNTLSIDPTAATTLKWFGINFENNSTYVNYANATFDIFAYSTFVTDGGGSKTLVDGTPKIGYIVTA